MRSQRSFQLIASLSWSGALGPICRALGSLRLSSPPAPASCSFILLHSTSSLLVAHIHAGVADVTNAHLSGLVLLVCFVLWQPCLYKTNIVFVFQRGGTEKILRSVGVKFTLGSITAGPPLHWLICWTLLLSIYSLGYLYTKSLRFRCILSLYDLPRDSSGSGVFYCILGLEEKNPYGVMWQHFLWRYCIDLGSHGIAILWHKFLNNFANTSSIYLRTRIIK